MRSGCETSVPRLRYARYSAPLIICPDDMSIQSATAVPVGAASSAVRSSAVPGPRHQVRLQLLVRSLTPRADGAGKTVTVSGAKIQSHCIAQATSHYLVIPHLKPIGV